MNSIFAPFKSVATLNILGCVTVAPTGVKPPARVVVWGIEVLLSPQAANSNTRIRLNIVNLEKIFVFDIRTF